MDLAPGGQHSVDHTDGDGIFITADFTEAARKDHLHIHAVSLSIDPQRSQASVAQQMRSDAGIVQRGLSSLSSWWRHSLFQRPASCWVGDQPFLLLCLRVATGHRLRRRRLGFCRLNWDQTLEFDPRFCWHARKDWLIQGKTAEAGEKNSRSNLVLWFVRVPFCSFSMDF